LGDERRIGDAKRPGFSSSGLDSQECPRRISAEATKRSGLGLMEMSRSGTLAELEHDCHVVASLGLAVLDVRLLPRDSVIGKRDVAGCRRRDATVARKTQVPPAPHPSPSATRRPLP
jgi:hypothetical protein